MPGGLPSRVERVFVVRPDDVGDVVLLGPAVRALKAAWPAASVTLLAPKDFGGSLLSHPVTPPADAPHVLLRRPTPCSPCHAFDCPTELECLDFAPDEVVTQVLALAGDAVDPDPRAVPA